MFFIPAYQLPQPKETRSLRGYIAIFRSKPLMLLIINILFIIVPYWIFVGMSPLLYIKDLGVSLSHFGYYQGVLALVFAIGSIVYGFIIKHYDHDQKKMLYISIQIFIASLIVMTWVTFVNSTNPLLITLALLFFVIGQIIPSAILYPACLHFMPQAKGKIAAIIRGGCLIMTAFSLQITGYFYRGSFQNIGIIITGFIFLAVVFLFFVIKNCELLDTVKE